MSKITKFISSALNNSNANEAAQALKMAAATMQKEGVNPASCLQQKSAVNDSVKLEKLKIKYADLEQTFELVRQNAKHLERELASAKLSNFSPAELREAKELAIKWHRIAQEQGIQLSELASITVEGQDRATLLEYNAEKQKNRLQTIFVVTCIAVAAIAYHMGDGNGYDRGFDIGKRTPTQQVEENDVSRAESLPAHTPQPAKVAINSGSEVINNLPSKPVPQPITKKAFDKKWHPKSGIYNFDAICKGDKSNFNVAYTINMHDKTADQTSKTVYGEYHLTMPSEYGMVYGDKFKIIFDEVSVARDCTVTKSWEE